eukprot:TRINITY_DN1522_c0_g1_i1.p1 TRINITY_DN1522_c0_g1~~TRINITY_DN1522_c0_g1_i1.p1  ORF type:complete len:331 (-),score=88.81 TRINITY_DN1522_c0_g1_i1:62-1054(-)
MSEKSSLLDTSPDDSFQPADMFGKNYADITNPQRQQEHQQAVGSENPALSQMQFEDFHLANNQPAYNPPAAAASSYASQTFSAPPQPPVVPLMQPVDADFGAPHPAQFDAPQAVDPRVHKFWHIQFYQFLFNVTTKQVLHRTFRSITPFPPNFFHIIADNPDFYGPFWIATTLVFFFAAAGNVSSYFEHLKGSQVALWTFDITKLSAAAGALYGYLGIVPLVLWAIFKYFGVAIGWMSIVCIYGYSFFIYMPISFLSIIPYSWLQWTLVGIAGGISTTLLVLNFFAAMKDHIGKAFIFVIVIAALHIGFALTFKLYFFDTQKTITIHISS